MTEQSLGVTGAGVALVSDAAYFSTARAMIASAGRFCLSAIFIVDTDPVEDAEMRVDDLLFGMAAARWRGVDARLVIGGSRDNHNIRDACLTARSRALSLGVPTRLIAASNQRSVHAKFVVADDLTLLGSHNWSPGALGGQLQDSVLIDRPELAAYCLSRFEEHWAIARKEGFDVLD